MIFERGRLLQVGPPRLQNLQRLEQDSITPLPRAEGVANFLNVQVAELVPGEIQESMTK